LKEAQLPQVAAPSSLPRVWGNKTDTSGTEGDFHWLTPLGLPTNLEGSSELPSYVMT
jgi:hypothetical protein